MAAEARMGLLSKEDFVALRETGETGGGESSTIEDDTALSESEGSVRSDRSRVSDDSDDSDDSNDSDSYGSSSSGYETGPDGKRDADLVQRKAHQKELMKSLRVKDLLPPAAAGPQTQGGVFGHDNRPQNGLQTHGCS